MQDYMHIMPCFGVVLLGLGFGNVVYGGGARPGMLPQKPPRVARPLLPLGRNSLLIYLVHQPILILLLGLYGIVTFGFF